LRAFFNTPSQTETTGLRLCFAISHSQATDLYAVPKTRKLLIALAIDVESECNVGLGTLNQTHEALGPPLHSLISHVIRSDHINPTGARIWSRYTRA
jgi:hypothetical protein